MDSDDAARERLHKFLARAGVASRRACEEMIAQGRVTVNGETITAMGHMVDPDEDDVRFDGERAQAESPVYWLVHKPKGVVCTTDDQFGRTSVIDLVPDKRSKRLHPVGRLEEDSEGLIIVTNDGSFTQKLSRMGTPLRHTYFLKLRGELSNEMLERARQGVWLSDGRSGEMHIKVLRLGKKVSTVLATPSASQHRLVRRVFAKVGVLPEQVVRVRIGPINSDGLKRGTARRLKPEEVELLLDPPLDALVDFGSRRPQRGRRSGKALPAKAGAPGRPAPRKVGGRIGSGRSSGGSASEGRPAGGRPSASGSRSAAGGRSAGASRGSGPGRPPAGAGSKPAGSGRSPTGRRPEGRGEGAGYDEAPRRRGAPEGRSKGPGAPHGKGSFKKTSARGTDPRRPDARKGPSKPPRTNPYDDDFAPRRTIGP